MTEFTRHTIETAPEGSKGLMETAQKEYQFLPNLYKVMADAPALLEGYRTLSKIFDKTSFTETERQIILMTNNLLNGCTYCMSAHTALSQMGGVPEDVIKSLRTNTPIKDSKLEALRQFGIAMNEKRGWVDEADLDAVLKAGYSKQNILEVIVGMALKVMSNYTNHLAETELDDAFKPVTWTKDELK